MIQIRGVGKRYEILVDGVVADTAPSIEVARQVAREEAELIMRETRKCLRCGHPIARVNPRFNPVPEGHRRHGGQGLCVACHSARRRRRQGLSQVRRGFIEVSQSFQIHQDVRKVANELSMSQEAVRLALKRMTR